LGYAVADGIDDPGPVGEGNHRHFAVRAGVGAARNHEVSVIEGGRFHPHADLPVAGLRHGALGRVEAVERIAFGFEFNNAHKSST
jgi:hypothetical protein